MRYEERLRKLGLFSLQKSDLEKPKCLFLHLEGGYGEDRSNPLKLLSERPQSSNGRKFW